MMFDEQERVNKFGGEGVGAASGTGKKLLEVAAEVLVSQGFAGGDKGFRSIY